MDGWGGRSPMTSQKSIDRIIMDELVEKDM